jgi:hypothetical protein
MINRRFMIVPPALPSDGHAEQLEQTSKDFPCLLLETANMREDSVSMKPAGSMAVTMNIGPLVLTNFGPPSGV